MNMLALYLNGPEKCFLKGLNISYNSLTFDKNHQEDYIASREFVANMCEYFDKTEVLNHIDLSGLNFGAQQFSELMQSLPNVKFLEAVHLNDNLISEDLKLKKRLLEAFGVFEV